MVKIVAIRRLPEAEVETWIAKASEVMEFLNLKTHKFFRARNPMGIATANADVIMHRLKEGYSVQDCKSVIALKCRMWLYDEKMSHCLNPETLFRRSNFERYIGEIGSEDV